MVNRPRSSPTVPRWPGTNCTGTWTNCTTVTAGTSGTVSLPFGGSCVVAESTQFYVRVRGIGAPGFECRTYTLQYSFALVNCHGPA